MSLLNEEKAVDLEVNSINDPIASVARVHITDAAHAWARITAPYPPPLVLREFAIEKLH
jgi:hypothetical protein